MSLALVRQDLADVRQFSQINSIGVSKIIVREVRAITRCSRIWYQRRSRVWRPLAALIQAGRDAHFLAEDAAKIVAVGKTYCHCYFSDALITLFQ